MAVSFASTPTDAITVADQHLIYQVSESTSPLSDDFRFVITVYDGTTTGATLLNKLYLTPNTNEDAFFNLGEVVRGLVIVDDRNYQGTTVLHSYSANYFTRSNGGIRAFTVGVGSWNGTTETLNTATSTIYLVDGHFQISQGFDPSFTDYYGTTSTKKYWLTDRVPVSNVIEITAAEEDEGIASFINEDSVSDATAIWAQAFNSAGTFLGGTTILINATNGSQDPTDTTVDGYLTHMGAFPVNIEATTSLLSSHPTWAYYELQPREGFPTKGMKYRFIKDCRPVKHSPVQLAWANTVGGWDYLRFDGKKQKTVTREEKSYRKIVGDYDASSFSFTSFDRETQPYHVEAKEQYVLNGILTIEELTLLQYCMRSKNVMARIDGSWVPVIIQSNSMQIEEETVSKIFMTSFNVELAQYIRC